MNTNSVNRRHGSPAPREPDLRILQRDAKEVATELNHRLAATRESIDHIEDAKVISQELLRIEVSI